VASRRPSEPAADRREAWLVERAPAKVNLTLGVLGRRPDGYHELESLVAFAGIADVVTLVPGGRFGLEIAGPGATSLAGDGPNLIERAALAALKRAPDLTTGTFRLEKHLPVAAGIGGGSADAAAALRLIRRANPAIADRIDWQALAASIGADVPVCMASRASMMSGLGEQVFELPALPPLWIVLANPGIALATASVFASLGAGPLAAPPLAPRSRPACDAGLEGFIAWLRDRPNDLEPAAGRLCADVTSVRDALAGLDGARLARMSGSGPTCFALFASAAEADAGAECLAAAHPGWWVRSAPLS